MKTLPLCPATNPKPYHGTCYAKHPLRYETKTQPLMRWHIYGDIQANDLLKHRE